MRELVHSAAAILRCFLLRKRTAVSLNDLVPQMNEVAGAASWGRLNVIGIDLLSQ
jgi:hypothetical protein